MRWDCMFKLLLVLSICSLTCCKQPEPKPKAPAATEVSPAYGDAVVEGTIGEASNLIPILSSDASSHAVAGQIYNGLVKYDKNLQITGDLAESYDISPDGLQIVFHL